MDALDENERMTDVGRLLLELPIELKLGKMLLSSTVLQCIEPVLTLVACVTIGKDGNPFIRPVKQEESCLAAEKKKELAGGMRSDHRTILEAYSRWEREPNESKFF